MSGYQKCAAALGPPAPSAPPGLHFKRAGDQAIWSDMHAVIGSGWYWNRFLYLFGEGLETLSVCVQEWSFLVPPGPERMILGRNAYGAMLILENPNDMGPDTRVGILNPLEVSWFIDRSLIFGTLIGRGIPQRALPPSFLDDSVYQEWVRYSGRHLEFDEVLGIKVPLPLGGKMSLDNFQVEKLVNYYRSTAPIYAKALASAPR
jgi:hypothetical protein